MIRKLLIANRGEIACRIMRTAQARGLPCVAVYSDADQAARHVRMADQAVHIGGSAAADSYLRGDKIIQAAHDTGADAIHPGYGFLSENPDFVEAVTAAGLIFVGPSADAIRTMGLKDRAKAVMDRAGVPVVPGYHGNDQTDAKLAHEAQRIGYPVMIKAVAGGGGKGMRQVATPDAFADALASARAEARAAFGNDAVLIEKLIETPRHIEVQIFGDGTRAVHLFERDCSLQRRHQKVIEEAPAPGMTEDMRAAMGAAAVKAAEAIGYSGAGTVEFIVDGTNGLRPDGFWFMEMNTRLQVEHPVTEAITGVDLVSWQLDVAGGAPLPAHQSEVSITGHAFEARLYAEDVPAGFLPATGRLTHLAFPAAVRADSGVATGDAITPFYDPMIAKVISHAATRDAALAALRQGLADTQIAGTTTNIAFLSALAGHADVVAGQVDTGLIARDIDGLTKTTMPMPADLAQAAIVFADLWNTTPDHAGFGLHTRLSPTVCTGAGDVRLTVLGPDHVMCDVENATVTARKRGDQWWFDDTPGRPFHRDGRHLTLFGASPLVFEQPDPFARSEDRASGNIIVTPMPGLLRDLCVAKGDKVDTGQKLAVLEAMKMEHVLRAPRAGRVAKVQGQAGTQVQAGLALITLDPADDS